MSILAHVGQPIHNLFDGLVHPLTGVDHLLAMISIGVLAALAATKRSAWLTPIAFVGGMLAGGTLGVVGLNIPSIDSFIALTVIALGVAIAFCASDMTEWLPLVALAFGMLHGVAHGAEAPKAGNELAYILGFVTMTTTLHFGGAVGGWIVRRAPFLRIAAGSLVSGAGLFLLFAA
jgi:urease accessory protein